jgi:hypothetical protein
MASAEEVVKNTDVRTLTVSIIFGDYPFAPSIQGVADFDKYAT